MVIRCSRHNALFRSFCKLISRRGPSYVVSLFESFIKLNLSSVNLSSVLCSVAVIPQLIKTSFDNSNCTPQIVPSCFELNMIFLALGKSLIFLKSIAVDGKTLAYFGRSVPSGRNSAI